MHIEHVAASCEQLAKLCAEDGTLCRRRIKGDIWHANRFVALQHRFESREKSDVFGRRRTRKCVDDLWFDRQRERTTFCRSHFDQVFECATRCVVERDRTIWFRCRHTRSGWCCDEERHFHLREGRVGGKEVDCGRKPCAHLTIDGNVETDRVDPVFAQGKATPTRGDQHHEVPI